MRDGTVQLAQVPIPSMRLVARKPTSVTENKSWLNCDAAHFSSAEERSARFEGRGQHVPPLVRDSMWRFPKSPAVGIVVSENLLVRLFCHGHLVGEIIPGSG